MTVLFLKAIYRNAVELGLKVAYHEKYNVRLIIKMLIALALLPADRMYEGFQVKEIFKRVYDLVLIFYLFKGYKAKVGSIIGWGNRRGSRNSKQNSTTL